MDGTTLLSLLVMVVAGAFLVRRWRAAQARASLVSELAAAKGWSFNANEPGLVGKWPGEPFGRGEDQSARNVLRGSRGGHKFIAFDYSYQPFSVRSGQPPRRFGVIAMQLPGALPWLEVEHENLIVNPVEARHDIRFESELFNRTFRITSTDERYARAVIHPRLMELLLDRGEIGWRITDEHLLGWYAGSHTPAGLERRLTLLTQIADLIPPFVWRDYSNTDPRGSAD
ncbi:hypothetical protein EV138_3855 [Kribbella voronezhensis]|uniref:DUF3137 domain-containing protein n=1 Tax=Kribbella voronezhensis TaxID=2512212 RepID=A0A4R7TDR2_9ACTN|nr:hypothetical protein [Kribbella voronezhensis]TDU90270.1 hypothetical protein EV138_3855 [Kribbella voronezhensis]